MTKIKYKRNDNNKAIVYARYSSHSQNDASIEQQLEAARAYAKEHGLEIIKEYSDAAMSGRDDDRPDFNLMLAEAKKLRPSTLIVWKGDRIARDKTLATLAKHKLKSEGCFPTYVTENFDPETVEGELLDGVLEAVSSFYAKQSQVNIERGMNFNARNCLSNGSKKYGYRTNPSTKRYEVEPVEAAVVREIYERYAKGDRPSDIAADLNARGARTLAGKPWRNDSVAKILRNVSYKGVYVWGNHEVEGGMPVIIDADLWERVEVRREANKRHKRQDGSHADYWLVPKLFCGECGGLMSGAYGKSGGNGKEYYYYRCTNHDCSANNISKQRLEEAVVNIMEAVLNNADNIAELAGRAYAKLKAESSNEEVIRGIKARIREADKSIDNLMGAIEQGLLTDRIKERLFSLEEERKGLEGALAIEESKAALSEGEDTINDFINRYIYANLDNLVELKEILDYFIRRLWYKNGTLVASCRYMGGEWQISYNQDDEVHIKVPGYVFAVEEIRKLDKDDPSILTAEEAESRWREEVKEKAKSRSEEILKGSVPDI